jgi:hypothetical protein
MIFFSRWDRDVSINTGQAAAYRHLKLTRILKLSLDMGSFAKAARFLVLLQIALFIVSAVIMNSSVCHGARDG